MPSRFAGSALRCARQPWARGETRFVFPLEAYRSGDAVPVDLFLGGVACLVGRRADRAVGPILGALVTPAGLPVWNPDLLLTGGPPDRVTVVRGTDCCAPVRLLRPLRAFPARLTALRGSLCHRRNDLQSHPHGLHTDWFSELPSASLAEI
jgi:hypothetical protein